MTNLNEPWKRQYYSPCDGEAFLFYVAFGDIAHRRPLDGQKYRCRGVPDGFMLTAYDKTRHKEYFGGPLQGYLWDRLKVENAGLAQRIEESTGCIVVRGSQKNPETLEYLRDCVGLLMFLLDNGACVIYDPQMFHWWSRDEWQERIFAPAAPVPRHHVTILFSAEEGSGDLLWFHTRGMRKFGRPDVSVRRVGSDYRDAVIDLCGRFIEYQAFGGVIPEGYEIRMATLPPGGTMHHAGDLEDPDFNNVHVEAVWPGAGLQ